MEKKLCGFFTFAKIGSAIAQNILPCLRTNIDSRMKPLLHKINSQFCKKMKMHLYKRSQECMRKS